MEKCNASELLSGHHQLGMREEKQCRSDTVAPVIAKAGQSHQGDFSGRVWLKSEQSRLEVPWPLFLTLFSGCSVLGSGEWISAARSPS